MKLHVSTCRDCPFFRETPVLGGLLTMLGSPPKSGWCAYSKRTSSTIVLELGLPPGPKREDYLKLNAERLIIEDRDQIPAQCPLRGSSITVTLAS